MIERTVTGWLAVGLAASGACLGTAGCSSSSSAKASPGNSEASSQTTDGSVLSAVDADVDEDSGDASSACQTGGLPTDTYSPNLMKIGKPASGDVGDAGSSAGLTFVLESNEVGDAAAPPLEPYTNTFTLKLLDANGQPVTDATVTLPTSDQAVGWPYSKDPWMPLHQHGSSITPTVTNNGDGTYALQIYFFMPGLWQIYLVAQTASVTDSAEYSFCLE
jgi:hypothetical protein